VTSREGTDRRGGSLSGKGEKNKSATFLSRRGKGTSSGGRRLTEGKGEGHATGTAKGKTALAIGERRVPIGKGGLHGGGRGKSGGLVSLRKEKSVVPVTLGRD